MDEPLSNLDALLRVQMRTELLRLHKRVGRTTIYVTHDQVEAMTMADRVVVLRGGLIQQVGRPTEVYREPANRFVATFVGSPPMNLLDGRLVTDDGHRRFEGPITFTLPEFAATSVDDGDVTVGFRPEGLALAPEATERTIDGTVELVEVVGADAYLSASVGAGATLTVRVDAETPVREGDRIRIETIPGAVRLFGADGNRVAVAVGAP